ncbi:NADP-dependent oxidoreductase [uncultured Sphingomonas sp.]|uniref:NADP-dependent oxidoreductase n=1 Tax=uncultured Sphingomonas sp. TaxID=158754 RepID=UPI0035CC7E3D
MTDASPLPAQQRAVLLPRFGGPEVLEIARRPWPQPVDDEVLVRVSAASVNPVDLNTRRGAFPMVTAEMLPIVLGRDLAGTIELVGTRAHDMLSHGDRVFAHIGFDRGAQAEYVVVKAVELVAMPNGLNFVEAAAVPLAAITAWQGLFDQGGLTAGQRVLIHGAAGGVGHLAVQIAKARGATVLATASAGDLAFVRGLGADVAIDYKGQPFEELVGEVDLVLGLVGGDTQTRSVAVVKPGGMLVSTVDLSDETTAAAKTRGVRVPGRWHAEPNAAQLGEIADLISAGKIRPVVAETFPLDQVKAAHERQGRGQVRGKIVLTVD